MRRQAIENFLLEVQEILYKLEAIEIAAVNDYNVKSLWNPTVVSAFEHLRKILDYSAQDIVEVFNRYLIRDGQPPIPKEKIDFPYGKDETQYKSHLFRQLKKLPDYMPDINDRIKSIQSFSTGKNWLIFLITETNKMKHQDETDQIRVDSTEVIIEKAVKITGGSNMNVKFTNCNFSGMPVNGNLEIRAGRVATMPNNFPALIDNKTVFVFKESKEFIIKKIKDISNELPKYIADIYELLGAHSELLK